MKQIDKETATCLVCGETFPADELKIGEANDDHGIDIWTCPICGSEDYETNE